MIYNLRRDDRKIFSCVSIYHGTDNGDGTVNCFICHENVQSIDEHRKTRHSDRGYFNEHFSLQGKEGDNG